MRVFIWCYYEDSKRREISMIKVSKQQGGFTVLELVVVLVAIAILVALAVFMFGK